MVHVNYRIESENRQKKARQTKKKRKKQQDWRKMYKNQVSNTRVEQQLHSARRSKANAAATADAFLSSSTFREKERMKKQAKKLK